MKLMFYGAAREVTGSCHGAEVNGKKILVDCGLHQGSDNGFGNSFAFHPGEISSVVVTHAHIDHSGRLPLLIKQGFGGSIYATEPTCELLSIMLRDSAHIQETEAGWRNRKQKRAGDGAAQPLYTMEDAERVLGMLVPCRYNDKIDIGNGAVIRFVDAGHLLGSAYVEMFLTEEGTTKKVVFSGDIGSTGHPIIREPEYIEQADFVVMESTYGDRVREPAVDHIPELAEVIDSTLAKGGNVICPAFAVGRAQGLLYNIREIKERNLVKSHPDFPVYLDSPLASAATEIYSKEHSGYLADEVAAMIQAGGKPLWFEGLRIVETTDESKQLNEDMTPKVIISSSGMCDAGRIRHHLKHNLWRRECSVVFTGFQALGTLGRILVDGRVSEVKLFGDEIAIKCRIINFKTMSSHADKDGLMKWINTVDPKPERVFVVHGEHDTCLSFTMKLTEEGYNATAPKYSAIYDLLTGKMVYEGRDLIGHAAPAGVDRRESSVYQRLMLSGTRLIEVITRNRGGANKDLAKFADQIDSLSSKWDR